MSCVLEVCDYHGPYPGNFIPSLIGVGERMRSELGLDYRTVFPEAVRDREWTGLLRAAGIEATFLPPAAHGPRGVQAIGALARRHGALLLRSHFTAWDLETLAAARLTGARTVWHVHTGNLDPGRRQQAADLVKARGLGRMVDRVVGVSPEIGRELRARGFPASRVAVIPNGLDLARFDDLPDRAAARAALGLAPDARVVLAYCWLPHMKGADLILDAAASLGEPRPVVLLVGREPLREFVAARLGPEPPAWLRVVDPVDDPRPLLAASDVFVSASRQEAFSYAIGEAMACGLPVVSSDIPGPAVYFAADGVTTFANGDAGALAAALAPAVARATDRPALAAANRVFLAGDLALDRHVERVVDLFAAVLDT